MGQYQNLNQFNQAPILGDTATKANFNTLSVQVDPNSANTILAGDAVYMTGTEGTTILVDKCTATTAPFGYVLYSLKYDQFVAGNAMEIGLFGQIIYAEADGTITRNNYLEYVPSASLVTGPRMVVSGGVNPISGIALDNATDTEIFRFLILGQSYPLTATITGGSINSTPIGQAAPAAGSFTTLVAQSSLSTTISVLSTSASQSALTATAGGMFTITPVVSVTINAASVPAGCTFILIQVLTSGSSSYTVTFGTNFKTTGTLATGTASGKYFNLLFVGNGTSFIEVSRTAAI